MAASIVSTGPCAEYEECLVVRDDAIGLHAIVVVHSTRRGPAFGGIRRWTYASEDAARADAQQLAQAMSRKCALARLPAGGGKTVLLRGPSGLESDLQACYSAIGRVVDSLAGRYVCGPDVGTGPRELETVRAQTRWVNPVGNDAGKSTAQGVLAGMRAVFAVLGVREDPATRVAIAGLGAVGLGVARGLIERGVTVLGADVHASACDVARAIGVEIVAPEQIMAVPCDVFSPCAMGGVLDEHGIAALRCRGICGSANNQLADARAARWLVERDIVHAPDVIVSAGAVIEGVLTTQGGTSPAVRRRVHEAIEHLETVTREVLEQAARQQRSPTAVAHERADASTDPRV
jgi:glutamate dehydrogenase/leucine dehydrogenase